MEKTETEREITFQESKEIIQMNQDKETKAETDQKKTEKNRSTSENVGEGFNNLVEQAKSEKTDSGQLSEKVSAPDRKPLRKKKGTRRKKAVSKEPVPEPVYIPFSIIDKSLMNIIAGMIPFSILATFTKNDKYLLTFQEKETLALQWDAVAHKYIPDIIESYGCEVTLASTIGLFLVAKSGVFDGAEKSLKEAAK